MKRRYALILAILLSAVIFNSIFLFKIAENKDTNTIIVARVIDGDTFVTTDGRTIRLANINTPEKNMPYADYSKNYLYSFINKSLELEDLGTEKYGRTLGNIYSPDYINLQLVKLGYSSKFLVANENLKEFSEAEKYAIEHNLGMWKRSNYSDCIKTQVFAKEELAIIKNSCQEININGWMVKDESRKQYKLTGVLNNKITIHGNEGDNNSTDLFWNQQVWNNDRDTLYLFDSENSLISYYSYGY